MSRSLKTPALATALTGGLLLAGSAFASTALSQGYMLAAADAPPQTDAKSAEMKCGADQKAAEAKCGADKGKTGEAKCGADKMKTGEMSCGADKAHAMPTTADAKTADGKTADAKMAEGKCGEGKCGGSI